MLDDCSAETLWLEMLWVRYHCLLERKDPQSNLCVYINPLYLDPQENIAWETV